MATPFRFLHLPSSVLALTSFTTKTIQQQKCDRTASKLHPRATLSTTYTLPTIYRELEKKKTGTNSKDYMLRGSRGRRRRT